MVLNDPDINEEFVTTSICTRRARMEAIVVVVPADHPFINRESVAAYRHARIRQLSAVQTAMEDGLARPRERVSDGLLARLQEGLLQSDFTRNDVRSYFRDL